MRFQIQTREFSFSFINRLTSKSSREKMKESLKRENGNG